MFPNKKWPYPGVYPIFILTVLVLGWLNLQIVVDNKIEIFIAAAAIIGGISMWLSPNRGSPNSNLGWFVIGETHI
jgi:hypothetical protein